MCLKIWSVEDGSCPVTIPAHKRLISSLAIVERGRNVVSSSHGEFLTLVDSNNQIEELVPLVSY